MNKPKMTSILLDSEIRQMIDAVGESRGGLSMSKTIEEAVRHYYYTKSRAGLSIRLGAFVDAYRQNDGGRERLQQLYESPEDLLRSGQDIKCAKVIGTLVAGINPTQQSALHSEALILQNLIQNLAHERWTLP